MADVILDVLQLSVNVSTDIPPHLQTSGHQDRHLPGRSTVRIHIVFVVPVSSTDGGNNTADIRRMHVLCVTVLVC